MTAEQNIANVLRKFLKENRIMTQAELARKMDVTPAAVTKWLKDGAVSLNKIPLLCETLGITPNTLFGFPDSKISAEALGLYNAFLKYPEYQSSVMRLLGMIYNDIETKNEEFVAPEENTEE